MLTVVYRITRCTYLPALLATIALILFLFTESKSIVIYLLYVRDVTKRYHLTHHQLCTYLQMIAGLRVDVQTEGRLKL